MTHVTRAEWYRRVNAAWIKEVVRRGWLDGKLRTTPKAPAVRDVRAERKARLEERVKAWEARQRRAETALAKLRRSLRYYERGT